MIDLLFGVYGEYSGVPAHMGHWSARYCRRFRTPGCKFPLPNAVWRAIVQSGVAAWMASWCGPMLKPCCSIPCVGGDGTHIGIPIKTFASIPKAWEPPCGIRKRVTVADEHMCYGLAVMVPVKSKLRSVQTRLDQLTSTVTHHRFGELRHLWNEFVADEPHILHSWARNEIERWMSLDFHSVERESMRKVLHALTSPRNVLVFVTLDMAAEWCDMIGQHGEDWEAIVAGLRSRGSFRFKGVGSSLVSVMHQQQCNDGHVSDTTVKFVTEFVSVVNRITNILPSPGLGDADQESDVCARPDPGQTGIRYMMSDSGRYVRVQWPVPSGAELSGSNIEMSADGCTKRRVRMINNRARTQLWVSMCMVHECVVGYHLMEHEGRRDCLLPLYAFLRNPPKILFYDFACNASATALNLLPEYFARTHFCHDCFHGFKHTCPFIFKVHTDEFRATNTSLMEQFNSFLQTIRGVLRSGSTLLPTAMFWFDVFVAVWNSRKPIHRQAQNDVSIRAHVDALANLWRAQQAKHPAKD